MQSNHIGRSVGRGHAVDGEINLSSGIFTHLSLGWWPEPALRVGLVVRNLFDFNAPISHNSRLGYSRCGYDHRGRGYARSVEQTCSDLFSPRFRSIAEIISFLSKNLNTASIVKAREKALSRRERGCGDLPLVLFAR